MIPWPRQESDIPNLKLTYFDAAGRAEPIRVALRLGGVPFEDNRLPFPAYQAAKARGDFPLGSVPVLDVDGVPFVQTGPMLRFAARIGDASLYPSDPVAAFVVDSVIDCFNDTLSNALVPSMFERDPEKKLAMRAAIAAGPLAKIMAHTEAILERSGGPFLTGEALTVADIVVALQGVQIRSGRLEGFNAETLAPWPRVDALVDAYLAHPRIRG